jgi:hypothetical protein
MEGTLPAGRLKCREVLLAVGQRIERIAVTVEPDRIVRVACVALKERRVNGARDGASGAQSAADEVDDPFELLRSLPRIGDTGVDSSPVNPRLTLRAWQNQSHHADRDALRPSHGNVPADIHGTEHF